MSGTLGTLSQRQPLRRICISVRQNHIGNPIVINEAFTVSRKCNEYKIERFTLNYSDYLNKTAFQGPFPKCDYHC